LHQPSSLSDRLPSGRYVPFWNLEAEFNKAGSLGAYIEVNSPEDSEGPNMKLASDDEGSAVCQFSTGRRAFRKSGADFRKSRGAEIAWSSRYIRS
jgi:hypothetical protein